MYLSIFELGDKVAAEALSIDPASLYSAFEQVRDGRKRKVKRYPLPLLLTLLMLGKLAGETTVNGIVDWVKERQGWLRAQLDWPKRFPTNSTYSEALARCDAQQIVTVVASASIPQGIFPSNKPRGIESTRRRSPMCLLLYGVICGMISVIRRHPKTLMSFYSHAQIWLVSLTWCVPRLKMCKVQETSYQITEAELARFLLLCAENRISLLASRLCRMSSIS